MVGPWRGHLGLVFLPCKQGRDALATKEAIPKAFGLEDATRIVPPNSRKVKLAS
jgi:hypothetical protein